MVQDAFDQWGHTAFLDPVLADWLEEQGEQLLAEAVRAEQGCRIKYSSTSIDSCRGDSAVVSDDGTGYGTCYGSSSGNGEGDGCGYGEGESPGEGDGYGDGDGDTGITGAGVGGGDGLGGGSSCGFSNGRGDGTGSGSGDW
jgi:hypothetical protein